MAGLLAGAAGAARAEEPLFPLFKSLCADTRAASQPALAAAEKLSWTPIPQNMLSAFKIGAGEMSNADGRMTTNAAGLQAVIVAHARDSGHEADICAVAFSTADLAAVKGEAAAFAAVEPTSAALAGVSQDENATVYVWRDKDGRRERLTTVDLAALDPNVTILLAGTAGPATVVALIVPVK